MNFDLKEMYNYLISHTFPGFILCLEIILGLEYLADVNAFNFITHMLNKGFATSSIVVIIGYVFSTFLGINNKNN